MFFVCLVILSLFPHHLDMGLYFSFVYDLCLTPRYHLWSSRFLFVIQSMYVLQFGEIISLSSAPLPGLLFLLCRYSLVIIFMFICIIFPFSLLVHGSYYWWVRVMRYTDMSMIFKVGEYLRVLGLT